MDFTEDPFKDYRYEDPFNIEDPFADQTDSRRPTSVAGFETDDFFGAANGFPAATAPRSGRVSAPPVTREPARAPRAPADDAWAAWPNDNWAADDAWAQPARTSAVRNTNEPPGDWKTDNWASKADNWAADWGTDHNKNLNETWPSTTLPAKKERSPKPVKYAKSLVHTIGGIGRARHGKEKKAKAANLEARSAETLPSEEQQWAWAAAESARLQAEAEAARRQEDAELQLALAISRQEK